MAQLDQGWNLDIAELAYNPSAKDLTDAKVHHLLSEELWKPYRRVRIADTLTRKLILTRLSLKSFRRLSYSRHTVHDRDLSSSSHLNHNMHMHIRRMVSETVRKQHSKRMKRNRVRLTFSETSLLCTYVSYCNPAERSPRRSRRQ